MAYLFDDFQKFGKEHLEVVTTSSSSLAKSWLAIKEFGYGMANWRDDGGSSSRTTCGARNPGSHRCRDRGDSRQACFCAQAADPV